jgi:hypothetical protein
MADVDWGAPSSLSYGAGAPQRIDWSALTKDDRSKDKKQPLGQQQGPSWLDRLREFLLPATPTGPVPGSPDDYALRYPNPNPPVPTDIGTPGLGPTPSPAPTVLTPPTQRDLTAGTLDDYILKHYGTSPLASGYPYMAPGPAGWETRQAGGAVAPPPGHRLLIPVDYDPFR